MGNTTHVKRAISDFRIYANRFNNQIMDG